MCSTDEPKRFALFGAAGYVAPRHMEAIKSVGGELVAAHDPCDSVGVLDSYFPDCQFFRDAERFWTWAEHRRYEGPGLDYVCVCTPNDLHVGQAVDAMCVAGADVLCEKPLSTTCAGLDSLATTERRTGCRVSTVLQLRLHPLVRPRARAFRESKARYRVRVRYVTPRGPWYDESWKGDARRSGGLLTNIGVHLFDLLLWLFGPARAFRVEERAERRASGSLDLERADVEWMLSLQGRDLAPGRLRPERVMLVDDRPPVRLDWYTNLHVDVYRAFLRGEAPGVADVRPVVELLERMWRVDEWGT
jgi:UDP-N-acetyl-2-amino-2-deoxyglucuronate dehydrogenase